jgi:hypothetical protein
MPSRKPYPPASPDKPWALVEPFVQASECGPRCSTEMQPRPCCPWRHTTQLYRYHLGALHRPELRLLDPGALYLVGARMSGSVPMYPTARLSCLERTLPELLGEGATWKPS